MFRRITHMFDQCFYEVLRIVFIVRQVTFHAIVEIFVEVLQLVICRSTVSDSFTLFFVSLFWLQFKFDLCNQHCVI